MGKESLFLARYLQHLLQLQASRLAEGVTKGERGNGGGGVERLHSSAICKANAFQLFSAPLLIFHGYGGGRERGRFRLRRVGVSRSDTVLFRPLHTTCHGELYAGLFKQHIHHLAPPPTTPPRRPTAQDEPSEGNKTAAHLH